MHADARRSPRSAGKPQRLGHADDWATTNARDWATPSPSTVMRQEVLLEKDKTPSYPGPRTVLPPQYSRRILLGCWMALSSVSAAYYKGVCSGNYDCLICTGSVLFTSINYWRHAVDGWRRKMDMLAAFVASCYQLGYLSSRMPGWGQPAYLAAWGVGIGCYLTARSFGKRGDYNTSSKWHVMLHVFQNIANCLLYDGLGCNLVGW